MTNQENRSVPESLAQEDQVTIPTVQSLTSTSLGLNKIASFVERLQEYGKHHLFDQDKVDFVRSLEKQIDSFSPCLPADVLRPAHQLQGSGLLSRSCACNRPRRTNQTDL
jgi:hypothetical protein